LRLGPYDFRVSHRPMAGSGRFDRFAKPSIDDRYLREADSRSRREADVADCILGCLNWADSGCWPNGGNGPMAVCLLLGAHAGEADVPTDSAPATSDPKSAPSRCE